MGHWWEAGEWKRDGKYIAFFLDGRAVYDVPIRELATQAGVDRWNRHLAEKIWMTDQHKEKFNRLAVQAQQNHNKG